MFPGTYDERFGRWWPYQPALPEIFSEAGDYILAVAVSGDDVPTETGLLKFNWTGNWETAALTLIQKSSEQVNEGNDSEGNRVDHLIKIIGRRLTEIKDIATKIWTFLD